MPEGFHPPRQETNSEEAIRRQISEIREVDLSQELIQGPSEAYRIDENRFGVAIFEDGKPTEMVTYGVSFCKAVSIYNPYLKKGLLAHIAATKDKEKLFNTMTEAFGEDISGAEISVIEAIRSDEGDPRWPSTSEIVNYFQQFNPQLINVDRNSQNKFVRGVALNLQTGQLSEVDGTDGWVWEGPGIDVSLNEVLNNNLTA